MGMMLFTLFIVVGCSTTPRGASPYLKYPKELDDVHNLIVQKKTDDARMRVDDYLNKAENINWYGHAYFLKGFLYEMDDNVEQAAVFYRTAINHSVKFDSNVEAKALYNLSFVNERIQNWNELLLNLTDLMKRRQFFDPVIGQVEIPARLAAAYAVLGKLAEAEVFHKQARQNFERMIRKSSEFIPKHELAKTLYYLGLDVYDPRMENFNGLIKKLDIGQKYFLAAAEASDNDWSERASSRIVALYEKAWNMIHTYRTQEFKNDELAQRRQKHATQLEMASELYDLTHRLRVEEFPLADVNRRSRRIMEESEGWLDRLEKFAQKLDLGPAMVRNKKVANKKLMQFVDKEKRVKVNPEVVATGNPLDDEDPKPAGKPAKKLPPKDIGKDPNL